MQMQMALFSQGTSHIISVDFALALGWEWGRKNALPKILEEMKEKVSCIAGTFFTFEPPRGP